MKRYILLIPFIGILGCREIRNDQTPKMKPLYYNEGILGFDTDSFFLIDLTNKYSHIDSKYNFFDTSYQYNLTLINQIPFKERIELTICRKVDNIFIILRKIHRGCQITDGTIMNCSTEIITESEVPKKQFDFINEQVNKAFQFPKYIEEFAGWKYYSDGGYSMRLQKSGKFFIWGIDYVDSEGMQEIEKLWNELYNSEVFFKLSKNISD